MIKAGREHDAVIKFISSSDCYQTLIKTTELVRDLLNKDLPKLKKDKAIKQVLYINWMLKMSKMKFYLMPYGSDAISLFDNNLNSMIAIRYCYTITNETMIIFKDLYKNAIEIVSLHSNKKGEGKKLIKEAITLSREINLPLVLYTETDDLVKYYEQFNFVNHGKLGTNNEYLMVRLPK
ncbi:hypothetical protein [Psychrobacillus soli]|uniref:GNAT family N-acetyltransferase n=1 Tax=Psychrobacillus soli TaxID=1543965 RepID=A0A544TBA6_9BACI|nr:hypothetical protein [Psychrobacillus soli]TQR14754.1 hypothetical protein FG383_10565 [Psychrobacillus soli]